MSARCKALRASVAKRFGVAIPATNSQIDEWLSALTPSEARLALDDVASRFDFAASKGRPTLKYKRGAKICEVLETHAECRPNKPPPLARPSAEATEATGPVNPEAVSLIAEFMQAKGIKYVH